MTIRATLINASTDALLAVQQPGLGYDGPGKKLMSFFGSAAVNLGLSVCVLAVVAGAITMLIGRFAQHGAAQKGGAVAVVLGLVAGAVIGSAALLVNTGYRQGL